MPKVHNLRRDEATKLHCHWLPSVMARGIQDENATCETKSWLYLSLSSLCSFTVHRVHSQFVQRRASGQKSSISSFTLPSGFGWKRANWRHWAIHQSQPRSCPATLKALSDKEKQIHGVFCPQHPPGAGTNGIGTRHSRCAAPEAPRPRRCRFRWVLPCGRAQETGNPRDLPSGQHGHRGLRPGQRLPYLLAHGVHDAHEGGEQLRLLAGGELLLRLLLAALLRPGRCHARPRSPPARRPRPGTCARRLPGGEQRVPVLGTGRRGGDTGETPRGRFRSSRSAGVAAADAA